MQQQQSDIPVYLFTGFLESGKTKFIQETLEDPRFQDCERTLLIVCEEGLEEYDASKFDSNVKIVYIENEDELSEVKLSSMAKANRAERVVIEYNGMWAMNSLFMAFPSDWMIYQEMSFANANTFMSYNQNMRQQTYDKLKTADTVVFNRCKPGVDKEELHKVVRAANTKSDILYEYEDGTVEADDIVDPLPFDLDADIVDIKDNDYAIWYRDMGENLKTYEGKTVRFKAMCANSSKLPLGIFVVGREVMTCCEADIQPAGIACEMNGPKPRPRSWVILTAKVKIKKSPAYGNDVGPVLSVIKLEESDAPEQIVVTF